MEKRIFFLAILISSSHISSPPPPRIHALPTSHPPTFPHPPQPPLHPIIKHEHQSLTPNTKDLNNSSNSETIQTQRPPPKTKKKRKIECKKTSPSQPPPPPLQARRHLAPRYRAPVSRARTRVLRGFFGSAGGFGCVGGGFDGAFSWLDIFEGWGGLCMVLGK